MRRIAVLLLLSASAFGIISPVRQAGGTSSSTCAFDGNVVSGNVVIATSSWETSTNTPTVSDTRSTTWSQVVFNTSNTKRVAIYIGTLGSSGADTVTFTVTSAGSQRTQCVEIPGSLWSSTTDGTAAVSTFSGTPATITTGSLTTTVNGDLLYAIASGFRSAGNFNANGGEVYLGTDNGSDSQGHEVKIAGAIGSYTASFTNVTNDIGTMVLIALKPASTIAITDTALPDAGLNQTYDYTLTCLGGTASNTWSITSGSLQPGLSINSSTGEITGTPTNGGTNSITFQCSDGTHSTTAALSLKVSSSFNSVTHVQDKTFSSGAAAFTSSPTSGDLITVFWRGGAPLDTCTDTLGTAYQLIATSYITSTSSSSRMSLWAGTAPSTGADTVTCNGGGSSGGIATEWSNLFLANDNIGNTNGNSASPITSNSLTTLMPSAFLIAGAQNFTDATTATISAPFTQAGSAATNPNSGYEAVTTVTGYTVGFTKSASGIWGIILAAFRPTGGAAAPVTGGGHHSHVF